MLKNQDLRTWEPLRLSLRMNVWVGLQTLLCAVLLCRSMPMLAATIGDPAACTSSCTPATSSSDTATGGRCCCPVVQRAQHSGGSQGHKPQQPVESEPSKQKTVPDHPSTCGPEKRTCAELAKEDSEYVALGEEAKYEESQEHWDVAQGKYLELVKKARNEQERKSAVEGYTRATNKARRCTAVSHSCAEQSEFEAIETDARNEETAKRWDLAQSRYLEVLKKARNDEERTHARSGYSRAAEKTGSWWWLWGRYFPPIRWWYTCHLATLVALLILIGILVSPKILGGTGIVGWTGKVLQKIVMPRFSGRARVIAPVGLTADSQAQLFAAQLPHGVEEVRARWRRAGLSFLSGTTSLLSVPSSLADQISSEFPEIKGVNLGKFLAFLFLLSRYFSWRVESQVAFCPGLPSAPNGPTTSGRMRSYASLRWGWFTREIIRIAPRASDQNDVDVAAYGVAARILGAAQRSWR